MSQSAHSPLVVTLGESLIDQVVQDDGSTIDIVGGSPLNTALALSRQGVPVALCSRISRDNLGSMILKVLEESNVDLSRITTCDEATTRAIATPDGRGGKQYTFDIEGTSQGTWNVSDLDGVCDDAPYVVVTAALAATVPAMRAAFDAMIDREAQSDKILVFDPNVRPALINDIAEVTQHLTEWIKKSTIIKASVEDVVECWPGRGWNDVAQEWLDAGVSLVIVTDGDQGAHAFSPNCSLFVDAVAVDPHLGGDTIGAGDTFTAGLINYFIDNKISTPEQVRNLSQEILFEAVSAGTVLAGETCKRQGANPPWKPGIEPKVSVPS
jgi:fructokinase